MNNRMLSMLGVSALALLTAAVPTCAQTVPASAIDTRDEIIVTAQKRAENVQSVPIAITALNAAALEAAKIEDSKDLQFNAPNVTLSANRNLTIRGVGSASYGGTGDTNIGVLFNGVSLRAAQYFYPLHIEEIPERTASLQEYAIK